MRILYITRKYLPRKGGMEKVNFYLSSNLRKFADVELISSGKSQRWFPLVLLYFFLKFFCISHKREINLFFMGDALLMPLGLLLKRVFHKPVVVLTHGLDITWNFWFYQLIIPRCLARANKIICVSRYTAGECLKRGIPQEKIVVIPNGVDPEEFSLDQSGKRLKKNLSDILQIDLQNKKILFSVGRLIKRKGFEWFISNVFVKLSRERKNILYLIAGEGVLKRKIQKLIKRNNLEKKVFLLGGVNEQTLKLLYNASDILIMPNISVKNSGEGFGIVALEASSVGTPVIASNLQGIKDAVEEGVNGFLVKPLSPQAFISSIIKVLKDDKKEVLKETAKNHVREKYSWERIAKKYYQELNEVVSEYSSL